MFRNIMVVKIFEIRLGESYIEEFLPVAGTKITSPNTIPDHITIQLIDCFHVFRLDIAKIEGGICDDFQSETRRMEGSYWRKGAKRADVTRSLWLSDFADNRVA